MFGWACAGLVWMCSVGGRDGGWRGRKREGGSGVEFRGDAVEGGNRREELFRGRCGGRFLRNFCEIFLEEGTGLVGEILVESECLAEAGDGGRIN